MNLLVFPICLFCYMDENRQLLLTKLRISSYKVFMAVPWLRSLFAGLSPRRPGFAGQSMWDLWWTKWHWDRFFSEFFGFPLWIYHSTVTLQTHIIWGMCNMLAKRQASMLGSDPPHLQGFHGMVKFQNRGIYNSMVWKMVCGICLSKIGACEA
jgi:hypothetical protein